MLWSSNTNALHSLSYETHLSSPLPQFPAGNLIRYPQDPSNIDNHLKYNTWMNSASQTLLGHWLAQEELVDFLSHILYPYTKGMPKNLGICQILAEPVLSIHKHQGNSHHFLTYLPVS